MPHILKHSCGGGSNAKDSQDGSDGWRSGYAFGRQPRCGGGPNANQGPNPVARSKLFDHTELGNSNSPDVPAKVQSGLRDPGPYPTTVPWRQIVTTSWR